MLRTESDTYSVAGFEVDYGGGGYSVKVSTHIGFCRAMRTMAASPFLMNLGSFSISLPERRSILDSISANLHAMCAVGRACSRWRSGRGG